MAHVLVTRPLIEGGTDPLLEAGLEVVERGDDGPLAPDELAGLAPEFDGIVCHLTDRIDAAVLQAGNAGRLLPWQTRRSGTTTSTFPRRTPWGSRCATHPACSMTPRPISPFS